MTRSVFLTGRACRLPGASTVDMFARLLLQGGDAVTEIPDDRWMKEFFLHPVPGTKGKSYTFAAGIVEDIWGFDAAAFGISPREAGQMDPQQRLLLQVVWEALEDAGLPPSGLRGKRVGVYMGCSAMAHASRLSQDAAITDAYLMTGNSLSLVANRISHAFDLRGPSMTVDTACSSSMVALRLAQDALEAGQIDMAIVGGVNALLDPFHYVGFSSARMLSPKGRCQPFSASADGYVRAEGAVAFVLERCTRKALGPRRAHAVVRAVETNTDGWTVNVAFPSVEGQADLLRRLYARAGVTPDELMFVEAHGTGTLAGDPVEAQALGRVLGAARRAPLPIGSVKSNIGHLEPVSGAAGLLKALVALEHGVFPATLHAAELNPAIPFDALNLAVARDPVPLDPKMRFAGVSSFGFGGANAHAILERVDPVGADAGAGAAKALPVVPVLMVSAHAEESLRGALTAWGALVEGGADLPDLCAQARAFRGVHPRRAAVICDDPVAAREAMARVAAGGDDPRVERAESGLIDAPAAFVFSGNGSQYAGMGLAALARDAAYARSLRRIDRAFRKVAGWSIVARMRSADLETELREAAVAQPLLFADQMATVDALAARGLRPAAVMGHSGGEVAAACAAGILTLEQAVRIIHARSALSSRMRGRGTMGAVQAPVAEVEAAIAASGLPVEIAARNSPRSVTVVGTTEAVDAFLRQARRSHRWAAVRLAIDYPYHGSIMEGLRDELAGTLAGLAPSDGRVPFVSSVTGGILAGDGMGPHHWCDNVCRPVDFIGAMAALRGLGLQAFVEIGPAPVLQSYMSDCLEDPDAQVMPSGEKAADGSGPNPIDRIVARALARGVGLETARHAAPRVMRRDLPRYVWANTPMRIDRTPGILNRLGDPARVHRLLGREEGLRSGVWLSEYDLNVLPVLADHRIGGRVLMPATAMLETMLAAADQSLRGDGRLQLRDVDIVSPVVLSRQALVEGHTRVAQAEGRVQLAVRPRGEEGGFRPVAFGRFGAVGAVGAVGAAPDPAPHPKDETAANLYVAARRRGLDYGPDFARLRRVRRLSATVCEAFLEPAGPVTPGALPAFLDVIGADAAMHAVISLLEGDALDRSGLGFVPVRIARLDLLQAGGKVASARVELRRTGRRSLLVDIALYDAEGGALALLDGVRLQAARLARDVSLTQHAFRQMVLPVTPEGDGLPDLAAATMAEAARPEWLPSDDGALLVEAAAQAVAAAALARLAEGADGFVGDALRLPYVASLAGICLRSGRAVSVPGGVRVHPVNAGEAEALLAILDEAHPALVQERAALALLQDRLPALLDRMVSDGEAAAAVAVFGRDGLAALADAPARRRALGVLEAAVVAVVNRRGAGRALRIAELGDGSGGVLAGLVRRLAPEQAAFTQIVVPVAEGGAMAVGLPADRVTTIEARADAIAAAGPFDLVLSGDLLWRAEAPSLLLETVAAALAAGGQFLAVEAVPSDFDDLVFGMDEGWFIDGSAEDGPQSRRMGAAELSALVGRMRFGGATALPLPDGCGGASVVSARKPDVAVPAVLPEAALEQAVRDRLGGGGDGLAEVAAEGAGPARVVAVFAARTEGDPLAVVRARILSMRDVVARLPDGTRLLCVIPGGSGQGGGEACPIQTATWTFLRSVANEYPGLVFLRHDCVPGGDAAAMARSIAEAEAGMPAETEVLHHAGGRSVLRVMQGAVGAPCGHVAEGMRSVLVSPAAGGLDEVRWEVEPRRAPAAGEVEIAVEAAGLNYRDVMWAMGLLPEEALEKGYAGPNIGIECAGRVLRCGPGCAGLKPGDRVVTFGPGCMASHLTVPAATVARLPDGIGAEAAASVPVAFFTAWYALHTLARVEPGEWVLVHGGAGGVGLAAIQILRALGARVIATAGSGMKRALLRRMGVERVLDSRSLDFAEGVREVTGGRGVDVVLNALAGEAMERSVACLAPFGRFLELGKQDFYANTALGMRVLKDNIAYHGIDVDTLLSARPELARRVFAEVMARFADGRFRPLPWRAFDGEDAVAAFRLMQKSAHIGKIVLRPLAPAAVAVADPAPEAVPRPGRDMHLIVGGLGGLGLELAEQLVEAGARKIALMGRRAEPDAVAAGAIARWRSKGCEVRLVACDVADGAALADALEGLRPLASVIHSAMVLEDMPLAQITPEVLDRVLPAKITGAVNLDRLTRQDRLERFVLFTSLATLIGNHGQSSYVAANGFIEGIVRARRAAGLPALAVGWGGIGDVGYLARDKDRGLMVRRMSGNVEFTGVQAVRALDRLAALGDAADAVVHVTPMGWQAVSSALRTLSEPSFGLLRALGRRAEADVAEDDLRDALMGLAQEKAEARLIAWLRGKIANILQVPEKAVVATKPVSELGIDSLMGVELGLTLQDALGADVPTTAVSDSLSITEIAARIVRHLHGGGRPEEAGQAEGIQLAMQHLSVAGEDAGEARTAAE